MNNANREQIAAALGFFLYSGAQAHFESNPDLLSGEPLTPDTIADFAELHWEEGKEEFCAEVLAAIRSLAKGAKS